MSQATSFTPQPTKTYKIKWKYQLYNTQKRIIVPYWIQNSVSFMSTVALLSIMSACATSTSLMAAMPAFEAYWDKRSNRLARSRIKRVTNLTLYYSWELHNYNAQNALNRRMLRDLGRQYVKYKRHWSSTQLAHFVYDSGEEYKGIHRNTKEYKGIQRNTKEYKGIQRVTMEYKGIQRNTGIPEQYKVTQQRGSG